MTSVFDYAVVLVEGCAESMEVDGIGSVRGKVAFVMLV